MTRASETRDIEKRFVAYQPPSELDLPKELLAHFHEKGQRLRWIRYLVDNQIDERNLARSKREGWDFVSKGQLPEEIKDYFATCRIGQNNSVICQGDLILGTIDSRENASRQKYYENLSTMAVESTRKEARKTDGNPKMDKYVPIIDETEDPEISVGRVKKT
jgi:hypothetical protein